MAVHPILVRKKERTDQSAQRMFSAKPACSRLRLHCRGRPRVGALGAGRIQHLRTCIVGVNDVPGVRHCSDELPPKGVIARPRGAKGVQLDLPARDGQALGGWEAGACWS